ncbi:response regulator [Candidatus Woesearchaeota archaeon]|nr:response regulator [Candidatus Woesearchaeota archaeon]
MDTKNQKKKVMVVDDEYAIRELIALTLEQEYDVIKAESGQDALNKIQNALNKINSAPDLIILDIMMPNMDGYQVCRLLKTNKETKMIPIIMLTAKHQNEDVRKAVDVEADEYITKPFEPEMLRKRVGAYFQLNTKIERRVFKYSKSIHYVKGRNENLLNYNH